MRACEGNTQQMGNEMHMQVSRYQGQHRCLLNKTREQMVKRKETKQRERSGKGLREEGIGGENGKSTRKEERREKPSTKLKIKLTRRRDVHKR